MSPAAHWHTPPTQNALPAHCSVVTQRWPSEVPFGPTPKAASPPTFSPSTFSALGGPLALDPKICSRIKRFHPGGLVRSSIGGISVFHRFAYHGLVVVTVVVDVVAVSVVGFVVYVVSVYWNAESKCGGGPSTVRATTPDGLGTISDRLGTIPVALGTGTGPVAPIYWPLVWMDPTDPTD